MEPQWSPNHKPQWSARALEGAPTVRVTKARLHGRLQTIGQKYGDKFLCSPTRKCNPTFDAHCKQRLALGRLCLCFLLGALRPRAPQMQAGIC